VPKRTFPTPEQAGGPRHPESKLYALNRQQQEEKMSREHQEKRKIEWGSQIRSYVLHPYNLVKDHRTDYETGDANGVLDGKLDPFIEIYLRGMKTKRD
jgi:peptide chain release factor 2